MSGAASLTASRKLLQSRSLAAFVSLMGEYGSIDPASFIGEPSFDFTYRVATVHQAFFVRSGMRKTR
jgi:hypothetical protein